MCISRWHSCLDHVLQPLTMAAMITAESGLTLRLQDIDIGVVAHDKDLIIAGRH